jgi:regulator of protease activity HflC (stomatin/prohibitin superfamily)
MPVAAATYKWIDENGRVVYGDTPPPGVKAERMNVTVPSADPNAVRDLAAKDADMKKRQQDRAEAQANAEKAVADGRALLERCVQASGRMQTLRSEGALYRYNEKGEKVPVDAAERERAIAETDKVLRELNCAPLAGAPVGTPTTSTY